MRNANGFGSVYKKSGKRRRPWVARKTTGFKDNGQPIYYYIGYYATRSEALSALVRFNDHPFDFGNDKYTLAEIYDKWSREKFDGVSESSIRAYKAGWKIAEPIQHMRMDEIKLDHLQAVCDESGKNAPILKRFKTLMNQLFDYGVKHEYILSSRRDIVGYLDISRYGNPNKYDRTPFTKEELKKLHESDDHEYITVILILIYTGLRIGELLDLKKEDVHLDERWLYVRQGKTPSGIREVPIADKIMKYMEYWMDRDCDYLICTPDDEKMLYKNYYAAYWKPICPDHKPHDTRHTCISLLADKCVDPRIIRSIVGHAGSTVTETVYTHLDLSVKLEAINSI